MEASLFYGRIQENVQWKSVVSANTKKLKKGDPYGDQLDFIGQSSWRAVGSEAERSAKHRWAAGDLCPGFLGGALANPADLPWDELELLGLTGCRPQYKCSAESRRGTK